MNRNGDARFINALRECLGLDPIPYTDSHDDRECVRFVAMPVSWNSRDGGRHIPARGAAQ